jgi:hypothetical protein
VASGLTARSRRDGLIRYDERGCGLSDWNVPNLSFEAWRGIWTPMAEHAEMASFTSGFDEIPRKLEVLAGRDHRRRGHGR